MVETAQLSSDAGGINDRVREAISSGKRPTRTILSSLLAVHDELGYLPDEAIRETAAIFDTTINEVWGVASFYTNFRFTPPGRHVVEVCWGPTCHLAGAPALIDSIQHMLRLSGEGDTEDGGVSLKYNTCLGACAQPPVLSIDHHLVGRLTADSAARAVSRVLDGA